MSGVWGKKLQISIFGESHGEAIGITINGLPAGFHLDEVSIKKDLFRRSTKNPLTSGRNESDEYKIISGYYNGYTTGTPLCAVITNCDAKSEDYEKIKDLMRPSHADYGNYVKSNGFRDYRGGGHSSGRLTAPLVFCGAICKQLLKQQNIEIVSHVLSIKNIKDYKFERTIPSELIDMLRLSDFPLIDEGSEASMKELIRSAQADGDSVGGSIECAIIGLKAGIGEPFFDSIESHLSQLLFSIPAVKGIEFGAGYELTKMLGSDANDEYFYENDNVSAYTNNNGGVIGGISNGMPVVFNVAIKPTPSIAKQQNTINVRLKENTRMKIEGRHDPCIVVRALPVVEAAAAIAIYDLI